MFLYHQLWLFSYHFFCIFISLYHFGSYCQPPWPCADCCMLPLRLPPLIILNPWTCTCCCESDIEYLLDHTLVNASPLLVAYAELEMPMPLLLMLWLLSLSNLLHLLHLLLHMLTYLWWYLWCSSRCNTIWVWFTQNCPPWNYPFFWCHICFISLKICFCVFAVLPSLCLYFVAAQPANIVGSFLDQQVPNLHANCHQNAYNNHTNKIIWCLITSIIFIFYPKTRLWLNWFFIVSCF